MEAKRQQGKTGVTMVEQTSGAERQMSVSKNVGHHVMRSKADELSVWRSLLIFKRVGCIAMAAAFCAALDGYRKTALIEELRISQGIDTKIQRSTSTEVSSPTRVLSVNSLRPERRSSRANISRPGVESNPPASFLAKLCVALCFPDHSKILSDRSCSSCSNMPRKHGVVNPLFSSSG